MNFIWPYALLFLGLTPVLAGLYLWNLRRRKRYAVRYSSLALVRAALPRRSQYRRHIPFVLFLIALTSLALAAARPVAAVDAPAGQATIILAMDVSRSMCAVDIPPNRLVAAKDAAQMFIGRQSPHIRIGIVAFAGFAQLVQPPTNDQELLQEALDGLITGRRTAIGSAILESLETIEEFTQDEIALDPDAEYRPHIIVLLTDGASNTGAWPLDAAQEARERGVRVYTIGFGTERGADMDCGDGSWSAWPTQPGLPNGSQPGGLFRRGIDEPTLREIAAVTGGEYYSASSAGELQDVFRSLPTYLLVRKEMTEISYAFAALGALLAALAVGLSLWWNPVG